jgi:predicted nucleotidyltransferase component of viral defense system
MGKVQIITKEQKIILDEVAKNEFLQRQFYFTGGTALSAIYLHHRFSEDIDLFSEKPIDWQMIFTLVEQWSRKHHLTVEANFVEVVYIFWFTFPNKTRLKVDFAHHPYRPLEKAKIVGNIPVDSLLDIAVNKMLTINQRTEVRDFVDLYFLLGEYTLWDLIEGVRVKFRMKAEPFFIASDFTKVDDFSVMPRMIKPLSLSQLKNFFKKKANELGRQVVE